MVDLPSSGNIVLADSNQNCFSMPFDGIIESIYATVSSTVNYTFPTGITVYPYVQLYQAQDVSNTFTPMSMTAFVTQGYSGYTPANTLRRAVTTQPTSVIPAGTRILITGAMTAIGTGTLQRNDYFTFTGGIALRSI
jgi:hypothetical protein